MHSVAPSRLGECGFYSCIFLPCFHFAFCRGCYFLPSGIQSLWIKERLQSGKVSTPPPRQVNEVVQREFIFCFRVFIYFPSGSLVAALRGRARAGRADLEGGVKD